MQIIDWIDRAGWTDQPECVHPVIRSLAIRVNDKFPDDERQKLLDLVPRLMGTNTGGKELSVRLAVFCARRVLHLAKDEAARLAVEAAETWLGEQTEENSQKARDAAHAAHAAATAAHATAAYAAATAAYAAHAAAAAAATYATAAYTAATATYAAATATYAAHAAAAYAAAHATAAHAAATAAHATAAYAAAAYDTLVAVLDEYDRLAGRGRHEAVDLEPVARMMAQA